MNPIITNFLTQLKSKQPKDHTHSEFWDRASDLMVLYEFADQEEDKAVLRDVYAKMVKYIESVKRSGYVLNSKALETIDARIKERDGK